MQGGLARRLSHCLLAAFFLIGMGLPSRNGIAFVDGPPLATTGGFGETTCRMCHFDYELNHPSGSLRVEGIPENYKAGVEYFITIRLSHPQMERAGFEMASRFATGEQMGRQAGKLEAGDERLSVDTSTSGIQYIRQTRAGSSPESKGLAAWSFRWVAPREASGPVVFHVGANAANYDDSPLGDYPYAQEITTRP